MKILTTVTLLILASCTGAWAQCRCCVYPSLAEAIVRSDAVFVGTVTDVEWQWNVVNWTTTQIRNWFRFDGGSYVAPRSHLAATVSIATVIKGQVPQEVTVHTYPSGGWCGVDFQRGESYLVYAVRDGWQLWSGRCSRSGDARELGGEIEAIKRLSGSVPHNSRLNPAFGPVTGRATDARPVPVSPAG